MFSFLFVKYTRTFYEVIYRLCRPVNNHRDNSIKYYKTMSRAHECECIKMLN